jgi:hypothetical protein
MQEPYEIIESYLAGNVRGRTQIPYGAGVHQEAICHRGGKLASPPVVTRLRALYGRMPSFRN